MRLSLSPGSALEGKAFLSLYRFQKGRPDSVLALSYLEHKPESSACSHSATMAPGQRCKEPFSNGPLAQGSPCGPFFQASLILRLNLRSTLSLSPESTKLRLAAILYRIFNLHRDLYQGQAPKICPDPSAVQIAPIPCLPSPTSTHYFTWTLLQVTSAYRSQ